jgi:hypothetical protein
MGKGQQPSSSGVSFIFQRAVQGQIESVKSVSGCMNFIIGSIHRDRPWSGTGEQLNN